MRPNVPLWICDKCRQIFPTEEMVTLSEYEMVPFPYLGMDIKYNLCMDCMLEVNNFINSPQDKYYADFDESHHNMLKEMLDTRREEICDFGSNNE